jgi:hypothetical protein
MIGWTKILCNFFTIFDEERRRCLNTAKKPTEDSRTDQPKGYSLQHALLKDPAEDRQRQENPLQQSKEKATQEEINPNPAWAAPSSQT